MMVTKVERSMLGSANLKTVTSWRLDCQPTVTFPFFFSFGALISPNSRRVFYYSWLLSGVGSVRDDTMSTTTNCTNWMNWSIYILFDYSNCSQLKCNEWKTIHANQCSLFVRKFVCRMVHRHTHRHTNFPLLARHCCCYCYVDVVVNIVRCTMPVERNGKVNLCSRVSECLFLVTATAIVTATDWCRCYYIFTWHLSHLRTLVEFPNRKTRNGCIKCKAIVVSLVHHWNASRHVALL